jgi:hypothetical protein
MFLYPRVFCMLVQWEWRSAAWAGIQLVAFCATMLDEETFAGLREET